ncbi:MAG: hypothetical protein HF982_11795 [Desulfobacteraceae bacterium]|nr:hypothetical protein [Desulfobacteraceae bacterium]MBC2720246.1 hypothetical protein [Desulfobacteraceae bacterium]
MFVCKFFPMLLNFKYENFGLSRKEKEQKYKKKTSALEKDLRRKEKALAETAALLVLKKKVQEIWGELEDE